MLYLILYIIKEVHVVKTHLINSHQTSSNTYYIELNYTCGTCNIKQEHVHSTCTRTSSSNVWHNRVNTYAIQGSKIMQLVFSILCVNCDYCMLFIHTSWLKKISTIMHEYFPNIYCPVYFLVLIFFPLWHDNLAWLVLPAAHFTSLHRSVYLAKFNVVPLPFRRCISFCHLARMGAQGSWAKQYKS